MFKEIKQLTGQSLIYGMFHIAGRVMTFLLLPLFTHYLDPERFGLYNLYYLAIGLVMELVLLGQNITLLNLYDPDEPDDSRRRLFSTVFWTVFATSIGLGAVMWVGSGFWITFLFKMPQPYPDWTVYTFKLCALLIVIDALKLLPLVVLRREGKAARFALFNLSGIIVQTGLTVFFLIVLDRGIPGIFEANVIGAALILLLTVPTISSRLKFIFDRKLFYRCMNYGLPLLPNALFVFAIELADRKILEMLRGPADVGLYSAGYKLAMFMAIVTMAVRFAWQPFFQSKKKHPQAREIFGRVLTYGLAISCWMFLVLTSFIDLLVKTKVGPVGPLIDPEYWAGLGVFPIILIAHIFMGVYMILSVGIYLKDKTRLFPVISVVALLANIVGNFLLIPYMGIYGAAWMKVVAYMVMVVMLYRAANKVYPIPYEWGRVIHTVTVSIMLFGLSSVSRSYGINWTGYLMSLLFPLALLFTGLANATEKSRLKMLLRLPN